MVVGLVKYARPTTSALRGVFVHRQNRRALGRRGLLISIGVPTIFAALILALVVAMGTNKRIYDVHTGSMTPTIPIKSAVLVEKGSYHVGQVISFRESGAVVTHRFVGLSPDGTSSPNRRKSGQATEAARHHSIVGRPTIEWCNGTGGEHGRFANTSAAHAGWLTAGARVRAA